MSTLAVVMLQEDELSEQQIRVGLIEKRLDNATKESEQIRVGLIEKRLDNATKESDDRVDKIQQKLDEANFELKRKEKSVTLIVKFIAKFVAVSAAVVAPSQ